MGAPMGSAIYRPPAGMVKSQPHVQQLRIDRVDHGGGSFVRSRKEFFQQFSRPLICLLLSESLRLVSGDLPNSLTDLYRAPKGSRPDNGADRDPRRSDSPFAKPS